MLALLLAPIGGLLNRWRGAGVWPDSLFVRRMGLALATQFLAHTLWDLTTIQAIFTGLGVMLFLIPGWPGWEKLPEMTARGILGMLPAFIALYFLGQPGLAGCLMFAGMTLGLCYRVGEWMPTVHRRLNKGPEWGEVLFGTVLWGFIIAGSIWIT